MNPIDHFNLLQNRRQFLGRSAMGLGAAAFTSALLGARAPTGLGASLDSGLHFPAKAKRVIFMFMAGAPSQIDLFDDKPELRKQFRLPLPESITRGQRVTAMTRGKAKLVAPSMFKFSRQGANGIFMSELLPHLSGVVDELCIIKSMHTDAINHDPAKTLICTGSEIPAKLVLALG